MFLNIIDSEQSNVNSKLTHTPTTYENALLSSVQKIIQAFDATLAKSGIQMLINNMPKKLTFANNKHHIDVYAESLTLYIIRHLEIMFPHHLTLYALLYHPFLLSVIQLKHNVDSWDKLRLELLETLDNEFSSLPEAKSLKPLLQQSPKLSKLSAFQQFHYLLGFYFNPSMVSKTPTELTTPINELLHSNNINPASTFIISINASHNIERKNSIICYHDIPRSQTKILNESTIESFNSFDISPCKQQATSPFSLMNLKFEPINNVPNNFTNALVVINYNESDGVNHYTVALFGKIGVLNKYQATDFMSFKLLRSIPQPIISFYLQESFYSKIYTADDSSTNIETLKRSYTQLMNTISRTFSQSNNAIEYITNIIAAVKSNHADLIQSPELPFFSIYLTKLKRMKYDIQTVIDHTLAYIYPDLLTSSATL